MSYCSPHCSNLCFLAWRYVVQAFAVCESLSLVWLQKLGLLALVNEESRFPKGTDNTLLEKLHSQHMVSKKITRQANDQYVSPISISKLKVKVLLM